MNSTASQTVEAIGWHLHGRSWVWGVLSHDGCELCDLAERWLSEQKDWRQMLAEQIRERRAIYSEPVTPPMNNKNIGQVYVLHYEVPQIVKSVSDDYSGPVTLFDKHDAMSSHPIRHYVGWTQQVDPRKRIDRHGPVALREVVYLEPGTLHDEQVMKLNGVCPKCKECLVASLYSNRSHKVEQVEQTELIGIVKTAMVTVQPDNEVMDNEPLPLPLPPKAPEPFKLSNPDPCSLTKGGRRRKQK